MPKLLLCLGQETFKLEVKGLEKCEEGQWQYWRYYLDVLDTEVARLVRHLGYCRFEPFYFSFVTVAKTEEYTKGLFGGEKVTTIYRVYTPLSDDRLWRVKAMYLEE